ncbi:MAG: DUF1801 domain-containing protein [Chitinophagaceae bacterium]|jgi:hypothetical protein|nr:DUF1801 domain-containing protein [Chitinophagaceae bacterium]
MSKYNAKTKETEVSVFKFIAAVPDQQKQTDALAMVKLMQEISGFEPKMWGPSIIGFGNYHYVYESGHEGDMPLLAFSPRKAEMVVYIESAFDGRDELLQQLGKHKTGKVCLYIKKLNDINTTVLIKLLKKSLRLTKEKYA